MATQLQTALFLLPLFLSAGIVRPLGIGDITLAFPLPVPVPTNPVAQPLSATGLGFAGKWEMVSANSGVSAMHLVIMRNNKAIMFDATNFGASNISLPGSNCRPDPTGKSATMDCWAHAVEFDTDSGATRPLKILTNPWCSSGAFAPDGTLVQTGGWNDGGKAVRYLQPCDTCDWKEYPTALSVQRWYATQQILPDGSFILIGGRRAFGYEFVPQAGQSNKGYTWLPLLRETTDEVEDNLYPFVHLSPDGNLFILANSRSILFDYKNNKVIREFPEIRGGSRSYPGSAMSVLLPLNLQKSRRAGVITPAEVLVCGGSPALSAKRAGAGTFLPSLRSCGRITITKADSVWRAELMPMARVMGDMLLLPNGEVLLINGASKGAAGWNFAREPALNPVLYTPSKPRAARFRVLNPSTIPRMYHSTSAVLPDASILVAGSNTNDGYNFTRVMFPTELRVERFSPPYLDPLLQPGRPQISDGEAPGKLTYGGDFTVGFSMLNIVLDRANLMVTMYAPPYTTHGYSMNQRLLVLKISDAQLVGPGSYRVAVAAPPSAVLAPPGYYMLFVVHQGVPSKAVWVQIQ